MPRYVAAGARVLPLTIAPPQPFPAIRAQSATAVRIAPGTSLVTYYLMTARGPLVVRIVDVAPGHPHIRIAPVLAHDVLLSAGETVSSMARRTGALAGINGDYFDIGQTNQPLNIVVRDGVVLRSPSGRATVSFLRDGGVRFATYRFTGRVTRGDATWALEGINEWPPQGSGAMLVDRTYGVTPARWPGLTYVHLDGALSPAGSTASFRVTSVDTTNATCSGCLTLGFGAGARGDALPVAGESVRIDMATDPPLNGVDAAVGGGPLLVRGGATYDDPDPPSPQEALQRDPQAAALRRADGSFDLLEVDGRRRGLSVGLTRPELRALMLGVGAVDGMAFDSGGSATIVARMPGDAAASLQNVPSDGRERNVADGVFLYTGASAGPPVALAVRPQPLVVLRGASLALAAVPVDAAGNRRPPSAARLGWSVVPPGLGVVAPDGTLVARSAGDGELHVRAGRLAGTVPLRVVDSVHALRIDPSDANPDAGVATRFRAYGTDVAGEPVATGNAVHWSATRGTIAPDGRYTASSRDATVTARVGAVARSVLVRVGRSTSPVDAFAPGVAWSFATFAGGGPGGVSSIDADGAHGLELRYALAGGVRAAYANTSLALPARPLAVTVDVRGDAAGAILRAAFINADGDRIAVTLARRVDWRGWRRCSALLPATAVPPLLLRALYVVSGGGAANIGGGDIAFRNLVVTFAGSGTP